MKINKIGIVIVRYGSKGQPILARGSHEDI